jgi:hypothetical protein
LRVESLEQRTMLSYGYGQGGDVGHLLAGGYGYGQGGSVSPPKPAIVSPLPHTGGGSGAGKFSAVVGIVSSPKLAIVTSTVTCLNWGAGDA